MFYKLEYYVQETTIDFFESFDLFSNDNQNNKDLQFLNSVQSFRDFFFTEVWDSEQNEIVISHALFLKDPIISKYILPFTKNEVDSGTNWNNTLKYVQAYFNLSQTGL